MFGVSSGFNGGFSGDFWICCGLNWFLLIFVIHCSQTVACGLTHFSDTAFTSAVRDFLGHQRW